MDSKYLHELFSLQPLLLQCLLCFLILHFQNSQVDLHFIYIYVLELCLTTHALGYFLRQKCLCSSSLAISSSHSSLTWVISSKDPLVFWSKAVYLSLSFSSLCFISCIESISPCNYLVQWFVYTFFSLTSSSTKREFHPALPVLFCSLWHPRYLVGCLAHEYSQQLFVENIDKRLKVI